MNQTGGNRRGVEIQNVLGSAEVIRYLVGWKVVSVGVRLGLVNGHPYISLHGEIKRVRDALLVSPAALRAWQWSHVAYTCTPQGTWRIATNGNKVAEVTISISQSVNVFGSDVYAFGDPSSTRQRSFLRSDVCQMRVWNEALSDDLNKFWWKKSTTTVSGETNGLRLV